jgi:hypothetical protein
MHIYTVLPFFSASTISECFLRRTSCALAGVCKIITSDILIVVRLVLERSPALLRLSTFGKLQRQRLKELHVLTLTLKVLPKLRDCCKVVLNIS